jgi:hypothetical protein
VPVLVLNLVLGGTLPAAYQPDVFWQDVPAALSIAENAARVAVLALPVLMPLRRDRLGWSIYAAGLVLYGISWLALILAPQSVWATSAWGFAAPAYTPALWLAGIGLIGARHKPLLLLVFALTSAAFLALHVGHTLTIYGRLY